MEKKEDKTYNEAINLLKNNSTKNGFLASEVDITNYKRVWSRDGVIQGIASVMSEDKELIKIFKKNLITLKKYQDFTGRIPSNVDVEKNETSYGTLVGKVDATLWYIIGVGQYYKYTKDKKFLKNFFNSFEKAICYLFSLELNGKGFLYIPTGGDWADEYITHGYVLFDQLLYLQSLKEYSFILKSLNQQNKEINQKINLLKKQIKINFFPDKKNKYSKYLYNKGLYSRILKDYKKRNSLCYFSSDGFSENLDCFANSLLLLTNILNNTEKNKIFKILLSKLKKQKLKILPAFWPPITSSDFEWKMLKMNSLFGFRNKPHHYHNGGLWPLIQGFFISSLTTHSKTKQAQRFLSHFSEILSEDKWQFREYYDSKNYSPKGIRRIGFSASGFIIAYQSVLKNKKVFL